MLLFREDIDYTKGHCVELCHGCTVCGSFCGVQLLAATAIMSHKPVS